MYKRLSYDKEVFDTDIYACIAPRASLVININRNHGLETLYLYNSDFKYLTQTLGKSISFPLVIAQYEGEGTVLLSKVNKEKEDEIKHLLKEKLSSGFAPKERTYKNARILFYSLPDNRFLACLFYKGIFAVSKNYKLLEELADANPNISYFENEAHIEVLQKVKNNSPVSFFINTGSVTFAVDYQTQNDLIVLKGYILKKHTDSITIDSLNHNYLLYPYRLVLPDSLCIDSADVILFNNILTTKISVNKRF